MALVHLVQMALLHFLGLLTSVPATAPEVLLALQQVDKI